MYVSENKMDYAVLHAHDTYGSIGDSILKIKDYVAKAKELGLSSIAITNHGSMSTFVNFYEECKKNNINPIIGCEIYFCNDRTIHTKENKDYSHLILLAKNYNGLLNLLKIHNHAQSEGFYYKPRADWELLEKYHKDIICLTACVASPLAKYIFADDKHNLHKTLSRLQKIFKDDLYLEIQPGSFEQQITYNDTLVCLAHSYNIKLVATNDIHYLNKLDWNIHDYHVKDARKMNLDDPMIYPDKIYYLMSREELINSFALTDFVDFATVRQAVRNTLEVAGKCHIELPDLNVMPQYSRFIDEYGVLEDLCIEGLSEFFDTVKYPVDKDIYIKRLAFELSTIRKLGFSGYFLIVKDFLDFCDYNNIARGPGRGSAAGSIVSFLLGISIADPIKYDLMFERFLSVNRKNWPDIDCDITNEGREELYQHLKEKYGAEHCCFVRTYGMRKARNAIKAACRILNIDAQESNQISKLIPYVNYDSNGDKHVDLSIDEALESVPEFKYIAKKYPDIINMAKKIEGYPSSTGIHPAGVVISPLKVTEKYPLVPCKNDCFMASSLDLKDVEKLSGVKFDLLSLSSLTAIHNTINSVGIKIDYTDEQFLSDPKVWELIGSNNTCGLFQISSKVYKTRMPKLKPKSIQGLAACLALVRGPCISSGADKKYISIINGEQQPVKLHDVYWEATKNTYGIVIYQEQILKICINIGFDSETAYKILKAVSKKKIKEIKTYKDKFYNLGRQKDIKDDILDTIWQEIVNSGLYAFNVAHATSYALLCYSSAYLMTYYPVEYLSNLLTKVYSNKVSVEANLKDIIDTCKFRGIKILPPDLNSPWNFTVQGKNIKAGFCSVKGIGESCFNEINKHKDCNSLEEFVKTVSGRAVNKRNILTMIAAGVFKTKNRLALAEYYIKDIKKEKEFDGKIKIGSEVLINLYKDSENKINKNIFGAQLF